MYTKNDIIFLKENECDIGKDIPVLSYANKYECYINSLFDSYVSKLNGIEIVKSEVEKWDIESKRIIICDLIKLIKCNNMMDFDEQEFIQKITG